MNTAITSKYFTTYPFLLFLSISQSVFSEDLKFPQRKQSIQRSGDSTTTAQLTNGCRYMSFGTYGHKNATANWADFESFQCDMKTDTDGKTFTKLLLVITDELGNKGKAAIGIKSYKDLLKITDGKWQTLTVPLHGVFYDWRYPEGQNGSKIQLDLSQIKQVEFAPWYGKNKRSGAIYLDNLRVVRTSNR